MTSNTPYAELVKRPWLCGVTGNPVGTDTRMIGEPPCDCQGCQAARAIEALEAEREKWQRLAKAGGAKCTPEHTWAEWLQEVEADADRRVEEERERCCSIIASLGYENDEDGFAAECVAAIRSRSNATGEDIQARRAGTSRLVYDKDKRTIVRADTGTSPWNDPRIKSVAPSPVGFSDEEVELALRPFAAVADEYSDAEDDDYEVWKDAGPERVVSASFKLGMYRRARAVLTHLSAQRKETPPVQTGAVGSGERISDDEKRARASALADAIKSASPTPPQEVTDVGGGLLGDAARFLIDRLHELEWNDLDVTFRDFCGHVEPAIGRVQAALAELTRSPQPVGGE